MNQRLCVMLFCLAALTAGCAGALNNVAPPAGSMAASSAPLKVLSGVIRTDQFNIPEGKTDLIDGQVTVFATKGILMEGTLLLGPTSSFRMFSPTVTWDGSVIVQSYKAIGTVKNDVISACTFNVDGSLSVSPGDNLHITAGNFGPLRSPCNTHVYGSIGLPGGIDGYFGEHPHPDGQDGGNIVIGTTSAVSEAEQIAASLGEKWKADSPYSVAVKGSMFAGNAGEGAPAYKPASNGSNNSYVFSPGKGADGGFISVITDKYYGPGGLRAGNGGDGGATVGSYANEDGTAGHPNGVDVVYNQASGGEGGSVTVVASVSSRDEHFVAGSGGNPTLLSSAGSGNGYNKPATPAPAPGTGGNLTIKLGLIGPAGHGTTANEPSPPDGSYTEIDVGGGDGGTATAGQAGPVSGANGGSFTLIAPKGATVAQLQKQGLKTIKLLAFGIGGTSGNNCPSPGVAGPNGANAGNLHDAGFSALFTITSSVQYGPVSFSGGSGANGSPPGQPGMQGKDDEGALLGNPGSAGNDC
ncbi:MAG: hypothetical protein JO029_06625 [Candidatus Eremiobacteraeota bacterium]|nr:hypothetical protein [Candidatus Eremiobacteraeota bacterium]MBV8433933.1 hypothetical protein [Candidatus Eremiobacteraeota bacterium]